MNISFVGAGNVAKSLGELFKQAGHSVKYCKPFPEEEDQLTVNEGCVYGEVVCLATPFSAVKQIAEENKEALKGKIVIDITNAINIEDWSPIYFVNDSGGEQVARLLPESKVVKAFNTIFADVMQSGKQTINGNKLTAFIASDHSDALEIVKKLADESGFHSIAVNGIKNARHLEAMAHLNIAIALSGGGTDAGFAYVQRSE